jgi:hypothetical protein
VVPEHTPLVQSVTTKQTLLSAHLLQVPPPQSTSVSLPFLTVSLQVAATHLLAVHTPLWQSLPSVHAPLVVQRLQLELPPQSTSLSPPFLTVSLHAGAMHSPPVHTPLWQSPFTLHTLPSAHLFVHVPPQSTSDSLPFFLPSLHVAAWHEPPVQTRLWQSVPVAHILPVTQPPQVPPPQSMSVSFWFLVESLHVAVWQVLVVVPVQTKLTQSVPTRHVLPLPHGEQLPPPQSMAVSLPFFTPSVHPAA